MRFPVWLTILAAIAGFALVYVVGSAIVAPNQPLILAAGFDHEMITPNADGEDDITTFRYELARNARISLIFEAEDGTQFYFREGESRSPRDYAVLFSGVVDGYVNDGETIPGTVERRLIPDGRYTWRLLAENERETAEANGTLMIEDGDSPLPIMSVFTLASREFTPNQDGVNDRMFINVYLEKNATIRMFLVDENGRELPIAEREIGSRTDGDAGRYTFEYEGGVDLGQDPPPDGTYTVVALAQDEVGQRVRREESLEITLGGKPRAEIAPQYTDSDVIYTTAAYAEELFSSVEQQGQLVAIPDFPENAGVNLISVPLGDMLIFRLTVSNYGTVPIRTSAPAPGTVYQQDQLAASIGALEEPGAWRVGIMCDTSQTSFPYRWAIGSDQDLITIVDPDTGREFRYLPAGAKAEVWGAIRFTDIHPFANPQTCWAGLIHEQVAVSAENSFVDPREIHIVEVGSE
jgi:hypothetical protein